MHWCWTMDIKIALTSLFEHVSHFWGQTSNLIGIIRLTPKHFRSVVLYVFMIEQKKIENCKKKKIGGNWLKCTLDLSCMFYDLTRLTMVMMMIDIHDAIIHSSAKTFMIKWSLPFYFVFQNYKWF